MRGDLVVGGDINIDAASALDTGNISYGGIKDIHRNTDVRGWVANNASVSSIPPIRAFVEGRVDRFSNGIVNDNSLENDIQNNALNFSSDSDNIIIEGAVDGRRYYISDDIDMWNHQNLTFDTIDGDIYLAVDEDITLDNPANITVVDDNTVRIYLLDDFDTSGQASVHILGVRSPQFWLYGTPEFDIDIDGSGVKFTRAIYAPSTSDGAGGVDIDSNADVYGGIVGGKADISAGHIYFDEALQNVEPLPADEEIPRVTHLHLSINRVHIEAS